MTDEEKAAHEARMARMKRQVEEEVEDDLGEISGLRAKAVKLATKTENPVHLAGLIQAIVAIDAHYATEKPRTPTLEDEIARLVRVRGMLSELGGFAPAVRPVYTPAEVSDRVAQAQPPRVARPKTIEELEAERQPEIRRPPRQTVGDGQVVRSQVVQGADQAGAYKGKVEISFGGDRGA